MYGGSNGFIDKPMRKVTFYDGTATTPLSFELTYIDGDVTASNLQQYLNEGVFLDGNGNYHGDVHGAPIYPEINLSGKLDRFVSATTANGTIFDFFNAQTGTAYADAVNAPPPGALAGRTAYRHVVIEYEKTTDTTATIAFESCTLNPMEYDDSEKSMVSIPLVCRGRVFADGKIICGRVGVSTTVPDWVPA